MSADWSRNIRTQSRGVAYASVGISSKIKNNARREISSSGNSCSIKTCTKFRSMFSDIPLYRKRIIEVDMVRYGGITDGNHTSRFRGKLDMHEPLEVTGRQRHKFFRRALVPIQTTPVPTMRIPTPYPRDIYNDLQNSQEWSCDLPARLKETRNVGTQSDYRESETQTSPWEAPYRIHPGHNPEVLTLAHLTWNCGLPAGVHEMEIIKRMRMKRAWEAILPPMDSPANVKARIAIISALEVDDWAFREKEIQSIMDMRMKLMEEYEKVRSKEKEQKIHSRFERLKEHLEKRKNKEIMNIRRKLGRELRKLAVNHNARTTGRYQKYDIVRQHADPKSELYAPQMRFGENPGRRHETLQKRYLKERYIDVAEKQDTTPSCLPTYKDLKTVKPKPKPAELCIRETRWNEEKLKQLHGDLKAIRMNIKPLDKISLMKKKWKPSPMPPTPCKQRPPNFDDVLEQSSLLIQQSVRGRAIQCMMFEGRDRCRELIEELQSTHALQEHTKKHRQKEMNDIIKLQREQSQKILQENRLCEILNSLEGMTVSGLLDYLSKELIRLQDERRVHAFALLAERERNRKEAAEAGRRQLEENRCRELDEMFKQIIKVNQDSVDSYLEDIIKEGIEWVSDKEAEQYISDLAEKVDLASACTTENTVELAEEEMVSDMVYNFVLPEVEKQIVRKKMRDRQQSYLRNAHAAIYDAIMELSPNEVPSTSADYDRDNYVQEEHEAASLSEEQEEDLESEEKLHNKEDISNETWIRECIVNHILNRVIKPSDNNEVIHDLLHNLITKTARSHRTSLSSTASSHSSMCSSCSSYTGEFHTAT